MPKHAYDHFQTLSFEKSPTKIFHAWSFLQGCPNTFSRVFILSHLKSSATASWRGKKLKNIWREPQEYARSHGSSCRTSPYNYVWQFATKICVSRLKNVLISCQKRFFTKSVKRMIFFAFFPTDDPSSRFWSIMVCGWVVDLIFLLNLTQTTYFYDFSWLDVSILRNSPSAARWRVECLPWSNKKRQKFIDFYRLTPIEVGVVWIDRGENSVSISVPHS